MTSAVQTCHSSLLEVRSALLGAHVIISLVAGGICLVLAMFIPAISAGAFALGCVYWASTILFYGSLILVLGKGVREWAVLLLSLSLKACLLVIFFVYASPLQLGPILSALGSLLPLTVASVWLVVSGKDQFCTVV